MRLTNSLLYIACAVTERKRQSARPKKRPPVAPPPRHQASPAANAIFLRARDDIDLISFLVLAPVSFFSAGAAIELLKLIH